MADYQCATVSQPFKVKEPDTFERLIQKHGVVKESSGRGDGLCYARNGEEFTIYGYASLTVYEPKTDEPVFVPDLVEKHIADGGVAIFKETGHTKCRFDEATGIAVVVSDKWVQTFNLDSWIEGILKHLIDEHGRGR